MQCSLTNNKKGSNVTDTFEMAEEGKEAIACLVHCYFYYYCKRITALQSSVSSISFEPYLADAVNWLQSMGGD